MNKLAQGFKMFSVGAAFSIGLFALGYFGMSSDLHALDFKIDPAMVFALLFILSLLIIAGLVSRIVALAQENKRFRDAIDERVNSEIFGTGRVRR